MHFYSLSRNCLFVWLHKQHCYSVRFWFCAFPSKKVIFRRFNFDNMTKRNSLTTQRIFLMVLLENVLKVFKRPCIPQTALWVGRGEKCYGKTPFRKLYTTKVCDIMLVLVIWMSLQNLHLYVIWLLFKTWLIFSHSSYVQHYRTHHIPGQVFRTERVSGRTELVRRLGVYRRMGSHSNADHVCLIVMPRQRRRWSSN